MTVPETSVHKYAGPVFCQYYVRGTWQPFDIDSVPVPQAVESLSQQDFRFRVPGPDMRHAVVPLLRSHVVWHIFVIIYYGRYIGF